MDIAYLEFSVALTATFILLMKVAVRATENFRYVMFMCCDQKFMYPIGFITNTYELSF